ncbi:hypothetical protein JL721_4727 [Aureococcus anophagefferens]|nr:hypothetical protein JL721_4727 [Aureococcus anophagefferens]
MQRRGPAKLFDGSRRRRAGFSGKDGAAYDEAEVEREKENAREMAARLHDEFRRPQRKRPRRTITAPERTEGVHREFEAGGSATTEGAVVVPNRASDVAARDALDAAGVAVARTRRGKHHDVIRLLQRRGLALARCTEAERGTRRLVVAAVDNDGPRSTLRHAFWAARGDGHFMRGLLRFRGILLEFASDALRADRDTVLIAVTQDGAALQHASRELRKDRDFVLVALAGSPGALRHAARALREDRAFAYAALKLGGEAFEFVSDRLRADKTVVLEACAARGANLAHAVPALRRDEDCVLAAVASDGDALAHAPPAGQDKGDSTPPALRANRAFVLKCVRAKSRNWHALKHASKALRRDRAVVLAAVRTSGAALMHAPKKFCGDKEIVLAALSSPLAQPYVSKKLARDKEVAFRARQANGDALAWGLGLYDLTRAPMPKPEPGPDVPRPRWSTAVKTRFDFNRRRVYAA